MESITKRRRFQAPITNFFDAHSDDDSTFAHRSNASSSSSCAFPALSNSTQSSLLTVGCRVRKSVPEGYKTHTTPSGGFTPRPFMSARLSPELLAAINAPTKYSALSPYASSTNSQSSIHDIGGLPAAIQPISTATFCGISLRHMPPTSSSPFSSFSSATSQYSLTTNQNKRAFIDCSSDGEDDDVDADFIPQLPPSLFSGYPPSPSLSPSPYHHHHHGRGSSYPFKHTAMPDLRALSASTSTATNPAYRKLALPKSRVRTHPHPPEPASPEQENFGFFGPNFGGGGCGFEVKLESASSGDFGEAEWLRQRHEVEMDCS